MRFAIFYTLSKPFLPRDYRRGFISLIKEAIKRANPQLFESYYSTLHVLKPFTFSVYFPGLVGEEGDKFNVGDRAILNFSTSSYEVGTYVYNGLLELRSFPLFDNELKLSHIELRRTADIKGDKAVFKTLSPVLVNTKGKRDWYLLPGQEGFEEGLRFSVREISRVFLGIEDVRIDFKPISIRRKVARHYNMDRQGFVGVFELSGPPRVLDLIYHVGLGVCRSQGFGMLEVLR